MSGTKKYKLNAEEIKQLITSMGGCIATDKIIVDGLPVKYMYREEPIDELDSGWRFFSGTETQDYIDNTDNSGVYDVNTVANYDSSIIPYLNLPNGVELEKKEDDKFNVISG